MNVEMLQEVEGTPLPIDPSWEELVYRIRRGDPSGLEELYSTFSKGVRFYLCRHLGPQDLDDRVHDVFLIIIRAIQTGELREPSRLMGYVRTVMRRHAAMQIHSRVFERRNRSVLDFTMAMKDGSNPERRLIDEENTQMALNLLESLHTREREVLVRFYLHEQTPAEICRDLDLSITQFRLAKSRAKAKFGHLGRTRMAQNIVATCRGPEK
jgi:RNA polymerase sigma factor (sigma-70 family)